MNRLVLAVALAVDAAAAHAVPSTYIIDGSHTYPHFSYSHLGYSTQTHKFDRTRGTVVMDFDALTGSVDVTIDATSVNTGFAVFDRLIQGKDYFDTARHPTIRFSASRMTFEGYKPVRVSGELTIKGVTRPLTLEITHFRCMPHPLLAAPACGGNATTQLRRSDFGMGKGAPFVGDEVTLTLAVEAVMEQPDVE